MRAKNSLPVATTQPGGQDTITYTAPSIYRVATMCKQWNGGAVVIVTDPADCRYRAVLSLILLAHAAAALLGSGGDAR